MIGIYNVLVPAGEELDRVGFNQYGSGGNANVSGGGITFNITTASGNTSQLDGTVPSFVGRDANTGQIKVPTGALAPTNSAIANFSNNTLSLTLTGFPGAYPSGSKMTISNLSNE